MSTSLSVGVARRTVLLFGTFFVALGAISVWFGAFGGWRHGRSRLIGLVPFGPQALMVFMIVASLAGLAMVIRIRPPRALLWIEDEVLVAEGVWGRRRCQLADVSSVAVTKQRRVKLLVITRVDGRTIRVGFSPLGTSWEDVARRLQVEIPHGVLSFG